MRVRRLSHASSLLLLSISLTLGGGCSSNAGTGSGQSGTPCTNSGASSSSQCIAAADAGGGDGSGGNTATGPGSSTDAGGSDSGTADAGGAGGSGPVVSSTAVCGSHLQFVSVYQPDVLMLIDRSSSMQGSPMAQAKAGLNGVADALASKVHFGVAAYPVPSAGCLISRELAMGVHTAAQLKSSWAGLTGGGGTPTGSALHQVAVRDLIDDPADPNNAKRAKALILITDGDPNVCESQYPSAQEAAKLHQQNPPVRVFVVGFHSDANPANLNAVAQAGGTDAPGPQRYYTADNGAGLVTAIEHISSDVVSCTQPLKPAPAASASLTIALAGQTIPQNATNGYTYDATSGQLALHGSACAKLQVAARDGAALKVTVACSTCARKGASCSANGDCCSGTCNAGHCDAICVPEGGICQSNGDCCSGSCALDGKMLGSCINL